MKTTVINFFYASIFVIGILVIIAELIRITYYYLNH